MPDTAIGPALANEALDVVELTRDLIRCQSVTPAEGGALQLLERTLGPRGFSLERMDFSQDGTPDVSNLYARIGNGGRHFCFAGHSDVVPAGDLSAWTVGPFGAELNQGVLFGRGAVDMKGGIAAFCVAASEFLAARGRDFGGSISLLITGDEEGPSINGTVKMLKKLKERGETIDACVVGEPSSAERFGDMMKIGRRGSVNVDLVVRGTQGHVAYPHQVDNPIHRLSKMISALIDTPIDQGSTHFQPTSLQWTNIDVGNSADNVAPGTLRARFNSRFNDVWTSQTLIEEFRRRLDAANVAVGGSGGYEMKTRVSGESFYTAPGELSDLIAGAVRDVTGLDPELSTTGGTSDARFIRSYCPVVEFGLVSQTIHKVDERSTVADLQALAKVYRLMLDRYFA
jgi:succinyl-diaminopimelate desuccinylase